MIKYLSWVRLYFTVLVIIWGINRTDIFLIILQHKMFSNKYFFYVFTVFFLKFIKLQLFIYNIYNIIYVHTHILVGAVCSNRAVRLFNLGLIENVNSLSTRYVGTYKAPWRTFEIIYKLGRTTQMVLIYRPPQGCSLKTFDP